MRRFHTKKNKPDFLRAVLNLDVMGYLKGTEEVDRHVYVAGETIGWGNAAWELARLLPGTVRPNPSGGLAWYNGSNGPHGVIIDWNNHSKVMAARSLLRDIVPVELRPKEVWTVGGVARLILKYIGEPVPYDKSVERMLEGYPHGYHECKPGLYLSVGKRYNPAPLGRDLFDGPAQPLNPNYVPGVRMYDCKSYYFNLMRRLSTLRVTVDEGGNLVFFGMRSYERGKFNDVLDAVENNKPIRNSLAGAAAGSLKSALSFTSSRPNKKTDPTGFDEWVPGKVRAIYTPGTPGPFRGIGLLLVATGAELCYQEALTTGAVYATIDSVALTEGEPKIWKSHGLTVEPKASGTAEFCHRGSYRVGEFQTKNYANGDRDYQATERKPVPLLYTKQWL